MMLSSSRTGCTLLLAGKAIEPHQFDAYCSTLLFNIGLGFSSPRPPPLRKFLEGDGSAAEAILLWNKPPEIKARRRGEHQQFLNLQHTWRGLNHVRF